jgi:hypothetical protein
MTIDVFVIAGGFGELVGARSSEFAKPIGYEGRLRAGSLGGVRRNLVLVMWAVHLA